MLAPERLRPRFAGHDPLDLASLVHLLGDDAASVGGEARLAYGDVSTLRLVTTNEFPVIAANDTRLVAMEAISDVSEWQEASADEACDLRVGVLEAGALVALATLQNRGGAIGHVSVFTAAPRADEASPPEPARPWSRRTLTLGLVPQWRSRLGNDASARVADKLGFVALGQQIFVRVRR